MKHRLLLFIMKIKKTNALQNILFTVIYMFDSGGIYRTKLIKLFFFIGGGSISDASLSLLFFKGGFSDTTGNRSQKLDLPTSPTQKHSLKPKGNVA